MDRTGAVREIYTNRMGFVHFQIGGGFREFTRSSFDSLQFFFIRFYLSFSFSDLYLCLACSSRICACICARREYKRMTVNIPKIFFAHLSADLTLN